MSPVGVGWTGSCWGGVADVGVMLGYGRVGWVMQGVGWGGSCRGGVGDVGWVRLVGHVGVGWIMEG